MKLPFEFGTKLVFRLVFPGAVLALATTPLVNGLLDLAHMSVKFEYLFPIETLAWGWLVVICDMYIYMLFEGRRFWPDAIRNVFVRREKGRLERLQAVPVPPEGQDRSKFLEAAVDIGQFPVNDGGDPYVMYPTRLGNILAGFENYPKVKYGLDAIFYWYRLWVTLDKDLREEIDTSQAVVDSTLYVSFALYISAVLALVYAVGESLMESAGYGTTSLPHLAWLYVPRPPVLYFTAAGCVMFARLLYRLSLPAHAQFGELFKSVFDQYRSKLSFEDIVREVGEVIGDPQLRYRSAREKNQIVWRYLKWHRARDYATNKNLTMKEWEARQKAGGGTPPMP